MATHSSVLAWRIPGTGEPGWLPAICGVAQSQTRLKWLSSSTHRGNNNYIYTSVQFSLVTQSCPTPCDPMDCRTPGLPICHQLLEFTQTNVHWMGDAIQPSPSHPLSSPSPPTFNLSQQQGLFQWVNSSHQVARVLEFQLSHWSFQWIFRKKFPLGWTGWISLQSKGL